VLEIRSDDNHAKMRAGKQRLSIPDSLLLDLLLTAVDNGAHITSTAPWPYPKFILRRRDATFGLFSFLYTEIDHVTFMKSRDANNANSVKAKSRPTNQGFIGQDHDNMDKNEAKVAKIKHTMKPK